MGRQSHDAGTGSGGNGGRMQRSQSRMSLSASFEALAVYFPCMNSFDEEEGGKRTEMVMSVSVSVYLREVWICFS